MVLDYFKENSKEAQELKQCKNELEKLNRKKSILYRKKCDKYLSLIHIYRIFYKRICTKIY